MIFHLRLEDDTVYSYKVENVKWWMKKDWIEWGLFDNDKYWKKYPKIKKEIDELERFR